MRIHHVGYRIRGLYWVAANDALRFFVSSISTAWRRPPTPLASPAARSTAGRSWPGPWRCWPALPASASPTGCAALSSPSSIRFPTLPSPWGCPPSTPGTPPAPWIGPCPCCPRPPRRCCPTTAASSKPIRPPPDGTRHRALGHLPQHAKDERQTLASTGRSKSPSRTTTRICSLPTSPSSTANSPIGSSSPTPSAPTVPWASDPRSPSSCSINPSAKGTGPIHLLPMWAGTKL
jgi:hypothetical protein